MSGPEREGKPPEGARPRGDAVRRSPRRRAREYALQGLYQWLVAGGSADDIAAHVSTDPYFGRADADYFRLLLDGVIAAAPGLESLIGPALDRRVEELSPVEHAILLLATLELRDQVAVPFRVVVNEAVELAKAFGGTDGHKFVNGVLDRLVRSLRVAEAGPSAG